MRILLVEDEEKVASSFEKGWSNRPIPSIGLEPERMGMKRHVIGVRCDDAGSHAPGMDGLQVVRIFDYFLLQFR